MITVETWILVTIFVMMATMYVVTVVKLISIIRTLLIQLGRNNVEKGLTDKVILPSFIYILKKVVTNGFHR